MKALRFEVKHPNGTSETVLVEGQRARIGHAAHCDVRLALDQAASEHVEIEAVGDEMHASALASPPPMIDGRPISKIRFASGTVLELNGVRIAMFGIADDAAGPKGMSRGKKIAYAGVALVAALLAGETLLSPDQDAEAKVPEPDARVFPPAPSRCPHTEADEAYAFASDQLALADARAERHPFFPRDGIAAVALYDLAGVCFHDAGRDDIAAAVARTSSELRASITQDFRARSLRLEYSDRVGDSDAVAADLEVLLALTEDHKGPYYNWLVKLARKTKGGKK
jgi:hypothetical protein